MNKIFRIVILDLVFYLQFSLSRRGLSEVKKSEWMKTDSNAQPDLLDTVSIAALAVFIVNGPVMRIPIATRQPTMNDEWWITCWCRNGRIIFQFVDQDAIAFTEGTIRWTTRVHRIIIVVCANDGWVVARGALDALLPGEEGVVDFINGMTDCLRKSIKRTTSSTAVINGHTKFKKCCLL